MRASTKLEKTYINPAAMAKSRGYAHAIIAKGTPVFVTGQIALDDEGNVVGVGNIEAQVEQVWKNIETVLADCGATLENIVKLTTYATDVRYMQAIGSHRRKLFKDGEFPGSTFLVVTALARPELLVEIEAIALVEA
jgi:2-iminobutanoate/2-iminopropanoate deaminase